MDCIEWQTDLTELIFQQNRSAKEISITLLTKPCFQN